MKQLVDLLVVAQRTEDVPIGEICRSTGDGKKGRWMGEETFVMLGEGTVLLERCPTVMGETSIDHPDWHHGRFIRFRSNTKWIHVIDASANRYGWCTIRWKIGATIIVLTTDPITETISFLDLITMIENNASTRISLSTRETVEFVQFQLEEDDDDEKNSHRHLLDRREAEFPSDQLNERKSSIHHHVRDEELIVCQY